MSWVKQKTDNEILDYTMDWSDWLAANDSIISFVADVPSGLTLVASSFTTTAVTVFLSGGTVGTSYKVAIRVTTVNSPARVGERSFTLRVVAA